MRFWKDFEKVIEIFHFSVHSLRSNLLYILNIEEYIRDINYESGWKKRIRGKLFSII